MTFNAYLDGYLRDVRSGIRKTARGRDFAEGTIYTISGTVMLLKAYQEDTRRHLDFRDIDLEFYRNFVAYLKDKGLSECYGKARDLFIIGICTAQRVSDFTQFRKEDVFRLEDGHLYIKIIQKKTGKTVCIPCNSTLRGLMVKYNFVVPKMPPQHINKYIKIVAEMAGLGDKAARITTHTARRTGATLMYLAGMDLTDVMTITGHSSLAMLKVYIKADEIDIVEKILYNIRVGPFGVPPFLYIFAINHSRFAESNNCYEETFTHICHPVRLLPWIFGPGLIPRVQGKDNQS